MSGNDTKRVYWDTCIFYALLKAETKHGPGILAGIRQEFQDFREGRVQMLTSMVTVAEVARGNFEDDPTILEEFKGLRFAPGFLFCDAIFPVMELASEIRDYYYNNPLGENGQFKNVGLGDAIHLATAIKQEASDFVTLDGNNKPHPKAEIGILNLGNLVAGEYELNIRKPIPPVQGELLDASE